MRFKLNQLKQKKIFIKACKGDVIKKVKNVARQDLLCSGSHLIERDSRKTNFWIGRGPVDSKLLMNKLDDYVGSMHPME